MQEDKKDILQAAEVILMIMQYEGEIEDLIEYPSEFEDAYKELVAYKVIKLRDGKYVPDENFRRASHYGFRKFIDRLNNPPAYKKFLASKPALGIMAGAVVVAAGFLYNQGRGQRT